MIASIDNSSDLEIYLERQEVERLSKEIIEGVLIKFHKPKLQGTVTIQIDDKRSAQKGYGIGADGSQYWGKTDFKIAVLMATQVYAELKERGVVGLRGNLKDGSKIIVYNRSKISIMENHAAENLEYYRDNKDQLPKEVCR